MLNELDKELERRGHKFVRYADDMMMFCRSMKSGIRTLANIIPYIENKLFLKVNTEKTEVASIRGVKFLGFSFYKKKDEIKIRIHPKSVDKMRNKIKEYTSRNNGWSNEYRKCKLKRYIQGWVNYFKIADIKTLLKRTDEWMRRRIRMIYWKQWKKIRTKYKMLKHFGINEDKAWRYANTRKGSWRISKSNIMNYSLDNKTIEELGYLFLSKYYRQVRVN